jgi:hypothetical protein
LPEHESETEMKVEKTLEGADTARMRAWFEGVGGNIFVGEGRLKLVKVSKKGNKLTLVVKKSRKKDKVASQPATA